MLRSMTIYVQKRDGQKAKNYVRKMEDDLVISMDHYFNGHSLAGWSLFTRSNSEQM